LAWQNNCALTLDLALQKVASAALLNSPRQKYNLPGWNKDVGYKKNKNIRLLDKPIVFFGP